MFVVGQDIEVYYKGAWHLALVQNVYRTELVVYIYSLGTKTIPIKDARLIS